MKFSSTFSSILLPVLAAVLLLGGCASSEQTPAGDEWTYLFDGEDLEGWRNPYSWGEAWVEDDEIHLRADQKFFLVTERPYRDFVFEGEVLLPDRESNSGFMFRANVEPDRVYGYQAEVDPTDRAWSGGLYDEGRRGWLNPDRDDEASVTAFREQAGNPFRLGEWNTYRIEAEGDRLRIYVNDVLTTDYVDAMDSEGYLGIQHHGEEGKIYRFRNLRVRELE